MGNSYTRQSSFSDGDTINSSLFNDEYDQLVLAFSNTTGHTHDGSTGEGGVITKVGPAQDIIVSGTSVLPKTSNAIDLGSSTYEFKNAYFDGTVTTDGLVIGTATSITDVDTDLASVSSSDDTVASAKAIKTYVDAQLTASDLDFQGDSGGALSIDLDSETLDIAGGTGIDTSGAANTLTVAIDSTVATLTDTQTFTNKTLTSPVLNTGISGTAIKDEDDMASNSATHLATQQSIKAYVDSQVDTADTLTELNDVTITTVGDNDIIAYDSTSSKYINQTAAEAGLATASDLTTHTGNTSNPHSVTATQVGLGNVTNESKATMFTSAALTGNPTAPTQTAGDNTTKIATTAFVTAAVSSEDTLAEMNDTTITSPADSHFLVHNGTVWVNETGATARTSLGVDAAGTDNSTNVTLAGTRNYLTLSGQEITLGEIDISDDTNLAAGTGITLTGDSLSVDYGTSASTACVGNDSRLSNSRQCNNSFDSASTSRTNLGLGDSATKNVGTAAGTVAAGDHTHSGYETAGAAVAMAIALGG